MLLRTSYTMYTIPGDQIRNTYTRDTISAGTTNEYPREL